MSDQLIAGQTAVDTTVPTETQDQLWDYWLQFGPGHGEPRQRTLWDDNATVWDDNATIWPT